MMDAKREAISRLLRMNGITTDADVVNLLTWLEEPVISTRCNCGKPDHQPPFRFLSDVLTGRVTDFLVWASRAGSKSYLAGLLTWVNSSAFSNLETVILGGSLKQSEKAFIAMNSFWSNSGLQDEFLLGEPTQSMTRWANGSQVSILAASPKAVRGPHPQRLILDEIDEMASDLYQASLSQPISKRGLKSGVGKLSTNHRYGGVMDEAVEQAMTRGTAFYKWCVWDVLEPCRDYSCSTCKLLSFCPGMRMKSADGYYKIEDFVQKLYDLSLLTLQVEWFCDKIGRSDLVYGTEFDEELHCPPNLPSLDLNRGVFLSIDWGGEVFSVGLWQFFEDWGWVRVAELYRRNTTNERLLEEASHAEWWPNVQAAVADPARDDLIRSWKDKGIPIIGAKNDIQPGLEAVRAALRPVLGRPRFYVNRLCKDWRREVMSYRQKNGKPVDKDNHSQDETRYFTMWQIAARPKRKGAVFTASHRPAQEGQAETAGSAPSIAAASAVPAAGDSHAVPVLPARPTDSLTPAAGGGTTETATPQQPQAPIVPKGGFHVERKGRVFRR